MIKNKAQQKKKEGKNSSFFILTYLARGKYIVESIKTEPDKRIYQQLFNSPRLKKTKYQYVLNVSILSSLRSS